MMIIHEGYENLHLKNPVVTLGIFDGVHRGHRRVIDTLVSRAKEVNGESVIITFYPHPRQVLSDNKELMFLTSLDEKIILLKSTGVDHLIVIGFNRDFSNREACEFVREVLIGKIGTRHLIVGFNHHFGRQGEGNFESIKKCAESFNMTVEQVRALNADSGIISSSAVRIALLAGNLEEANKLLGYQYFMNGSIVRGRELGRKIGYPTANIKPDFENKLIPKNGVYAVEIVIEGINYKGVMSIGINPTINESLEERTIEANIFDFDRNIYGADVCVVFRFRLREEIKFNNLSELAEQIDLDKKKAIGLMR